MPVEYVTGETGKATLIVNQTGINAGSGDIFAASASGTPFFWITRSGDTFSERYLDKGDTGGTYYLDLANAGTSLYTHGDITVGDGSGKLTAGTLDPPYTIDGQKYATFLPSMTGVKEETTGVVATNELVQGVGYRSIIDFGTQPTGSDIWLFSRATDLKNNFTNLVVLLNPSGNVRSWYDLDQTNYKLAIYTSAPSRVSFRLTAPRFDAASWGNVRTSGPTGFDLTNTVVPIPTDTGLINTPSADGLANITISVVNGIYALQNNLGQYIYDVGTFSQAAIANLRAGSVDT